MKSLRLSFGTIIILFVIGFLSGYYLLNLKGLFLYTYPFEFGIWESSVSLVLLLVFCAISARIILWAYSKSRFPHHLILIFSCSLFISIISAAVSIWLKLRQAQYLATLLKDRLVNVSSTGYINYFSGGFIAVLFACGVTTIILLWIARWQKKEEDTTIPSTVDRKQDIALIISTFIVFSLLIKNIFDYVITTLLLVKGLSLVR